MPDKFAIVGTSTFDNSLDVEMTTITDLRRRLGTSSLIWVSGNLALSGFDF